MSSTSRTIVYIDGFNFYYGAVKDTPHKWLDFEAFCRLLLPRDDIVKIRYFTARISALPNDRAFAETWGGGWLRVPE